MAIHKVSYLALLILFGMILLVSNVEQADAYVEPKPCPRNCDPEIAHELCLSPEKSKKVDLSRLCTNCCAGILGCSYFSANGKFVCKGESSYEHPKACPLNCDPRIAYGICPIVEKKSRICTNCCAGDKRCFYYGNNGNFICQGESEYDDVSEGKNDFQKIKLPVSQF